MQRASRLTSEPSGWLFFRAWERTMLQAENSPKESFSSLSIRFLGFSMELMNNREIDLHVLFDANNTELWIWIVKKKLITTFFSKKKTEWLHGRSKFQFLLALAPLRCFWFQPQQQTNTKKRKSRFLISITFTSKHISYYQSYRWAIKVSENIEAAAAFAHPTSNELGARAQNTWRWWWWRSNWECWSISEERIRMRKYFFIPTPSYTIRS